LILNLNYQRITHSYLPNSKEFYENFLGKMQLWLAGAYNDLDVAEALLSLAETFASSLHESSNSADLVYLAKYLTKIIYCQVKIDFLFKKMFTG